MLSCQRYKSVRAGSNEDGEVKKKKARVPFLLSYNPGNSMMVTGHSYPRRIVHAHLRNGLHDLRPGEEGAIRLAQEAKLDQFFPAGIFVSGNHTFLEDRPAEWLDGHMVRAAESSLSDVEACIRAHHPTCVNFIFTSNDLSRLCSFSMLRCVSLAQRLMDFAEALPQYVRLVIIDMVLPRTGRLQSDPETFSSNAEHYNTVLEAMANQDRITINPCRGFRFMDNNGQPMPCPVSNWSEDGIHPTFAQFIRYFNNTRRIVRTHHVRLA